MGMGQTGVDPVDCARLIVLGYLASEGCKSGRIGLHTDVPIEQHRVFDDERWSADEQWESGGVVVIIICVLLPLIYFCWHVFAQ